MTSKRSRWVLAGAIGALFLVPGCHAPLNASAKKRVLDALGRTMSKRAYVYGVDFSQDRWRAMVAAEQGCLDSAETDSAFAAAVEGVLEHYDVSHLHCFTSVQAAERRHGRHTGIGVLGVELEDGILAASVIVGSPAEHAGIQRGDLLLSVDGVVARKRKQFSGELGQVRRLEWVRGGSPQSAEVIHAKFRRASPDELVWLDDNIAWIKIHSFAKKLYHRPQVEQFFVEAAEARGIILDFRSNLGGHVSNVAHLAGHVLDEKIPISVVINRKTLDAYHRNHDTRDASMEDLAAHAEKTLAAAARRNGPPYRGKLVVLVDSLSGSGGELLPGAIQELGRGPVIGSVSIGRVLLADNFGLPRGFRLQLPIGEALTPGGQRIEGVGVQPDVRLTPHQAADDDYIISLAREAILR